MDFVQLAKVNMLKMLRHRRSDTNQIIFSHGGWFLKIRHCTIET